MTISINQIAMGMALRINNDIYQITSYDHVKPGKGTAFARIKLKNVKTGQVLEKTFKTADKLEDVPLVEKKLLFQYRADDMFHFMNVETYNQIELSIEQIGDALQFLQEEMEISALCFEDQVLRVEVPMFIEAEIAHTEPGFRGDTSKAGTKPATIDTGATIQVPLFVEIGDRVKIDTRTGSYVERVKK